MTLIVEKMNAPYGLQGSGRRVQKTKSRFQQQETAKRSIVRLSSLRRYYPDQVQRVSSQALRATPAVNFRLTAGLTACQAKKWSVPRHATCPPMTGTNGDQCTFFQSEASDDEAEKVENQTVSKKAIYPAARCFSERNLYGYPGDRSGFTTPLVLCSFSFTEKKTNQKKPPASRGPSGCPALLAAGGPCGTRLRSDSHRAFFASCCDARPGTMGPKKSAETSA